MNIFENILARFSRRLFASSVSAQDTARETALREVLQQSYAAPDVPDALRQRVVEMAVSHNERQVMQPKFRARWPRIALAVTFCSLTAFGVVAWPRVHAALLLRRTQIAMQNIQTAHITLWMVWPDGSRHKQSEVFYNDGQWHLEKSFGNWIYETRESLRAPEHSAALEGIDLPLGFNHMDTFSLFASPGDKMQTGLHSRLEATENKTIVQGKSCTGYMWTMDNLPRESQYVTLEDKTGLPVESVWRHQDENDVWRTTAMIEYEFNISGAQFPAGMSLSRSRPEGIGETREEWEDRLQTRRAYMQRGKTTVALRDVRVNCDGDLFVLYTAGHKPGNYEDWVVGAADDRGNTYLRCHYTPFRPTIVKDNRVVGFTFDGEALEGARLTPIQPLKETGSAWKPRRFTITMYPRLSSYYQETGRDSQGNKYAPLRFSLPIEHSDTQRVPAYMPYMAMSPVGGVYKEFGLQNADAWTRATYWRDVKRNSAQALLWFQRMEEINLAESRLHHRQINNVSIMLEIARLQTLLGHRAEARQTLRRADARRAYADAASVRELDAALRKEGIRR